MLHLDNDKIEELLHHIYENAKLASQQLFILHMSNGEKIRAMAENIEIVENVKTSGVVRWPIPYSRKIARYVSNDNHLTLTVFSYSHINLINHDNLIKITPVTEHNIFDNDSLSQAITIWNRKEEPTE